ncbi:MAG TPA: 2-phospho-L-lactate transferase [Candidatus Dormibacteraeota bacterium]|jgi:LPPG:FO 2-phospho-L-lactate transferase|nr:2-phospho-L-lactate transferase [Candidatus Dormibacteraeota bacterium]
MRAPQAAGRRVAALCGGIGGVKLVEGLNELLVPQDLSVICNTGDDLEWVGLHVSPDVDTVMYTLSGLADRDRGWGLEGETWQALDLLKRYGTEETWFQIGDRDLATHVLRTHELAQGRSLTEATATLAHQLGIRCQLVPMSNDPVRTKVLTPDGLLDFQEYFVRRRFEPPVEEVRFEGAADARPTPEAAAAILSSDVVIVAPSNPIGSIGPMIAIKGLREAVAQTTALRVAVSPLIGGDAVKGPTVPMMQSAGLAVSPLGVAQFYEGLIDAIVIDKQDIAFKTELEERGLHVLVTDILMEGFEGRLRLAAEVLDFRPAAAGGG